MEEIDAPAPGTGLEGPPDRLNPRRAPSQARSRRRVEAILRTTAQLIEEQGIEPLTTRLIAERAGIPVGSVYQFFENKYSVLYALAMRNLEDARAIFERHLAFSGEASWEERLTGLAEDMAQFLFRRKSVPILWMAMQVSPELRAVEQQAHAEAVKYTSAVLTSFLPHKTPETCELLAQVIVRVANAMLFFASQEESETRRKAIVGELEALLKTYVAGHMAA